MGFFVCLAREAHEIWKYRSDAGSGFGSRAVVRLGGERLSDALSDTQGCRHR